MNIPKLFTILALLIIMVYFTACQDDDNPVDSSPTNDYITFSKTYTPVSWLFRKTGIIATKDSCFVLAGDAEDYNENVVLTKKDVNGNTLWVKWFTYSRFDFCYHLSECRNSDIVVGGTTQQENRYDTVFLIKTDSYGNLIWRDTFNGNIDSYIKPLIKTTSDDGYIIATTNNHDFDDDKKLVLTKTNSEGSIAWSNSFQLGYPRAICQTGDGGFLLVLKDRLYYEDFESQLLKIGQNGDSLWVRSFNEMNGQLILNFNSINNTIFELMHTNYPSGDEMNIVSLNSDGTIISTVDLGNNLLGNVIKTKDNCYAVCKGRPLSLSKTDLRGNIIWKREYNRNTDGIIKQTSDGGFAILGTEYIEDDWSGKEAFLLIKTDPDGFVYTTK